jgi:hypothetical protein
MDTHTNKYKDKGRTDAKITAPVSEMHCNFSTIVLALYVYQKLAMGQLCGHVGFSVVGNVDWIESECEVMV